MIDRETHHPGPPQTETTPPLPCAVYVALVLSIYVELPETPARASAQDRRYAQQMFARGVPHETVETALMLASLRRLSRPVHAAPLGSIGSLAYFQPVIEELLERPAPGGYLDYLRGKLDGLTRRRTPVRS